MKIIRVTDARGVEYAFAADRFIVLKETHAGRPKNASDDPDTDNTDWDGTTEFILIYLEGMAEPIQVQCYHPVGNAARSRRFAEELVEIIVAQLEHP